MDNSALFALIASFGLLFTVLGLFYYFGTAFGLYKMAISSNLQNPWLAWIPFGNAYILGSIVEEVDFLGQRITNLGLIYLIAPFAIAIAAKILALIPVLGWLATIVIEILFLILSIKVVYKMFTLFVSESATLFTVLSFIIPFAAPVCFIIAGNHPRIDNYSNGGGFSSGPDKTSSI